MDITTIKKRDGRLVGFDRAKIQAAMESAARAVDPDADLRPFRLIIDHVIRHIEIKYGDTTPDVEGVQDLVEQTLMEHGHYEVGKAYILYRAAQAKRRETTPDELAPAQTSLSLVNQDGAQQVVSEQHIRDIFVEYAGGLEAINVDLLVSRCLSELHDGMKATDLDTAVTFAARSNIELDPEYSQLAARLGMRSLYQEVFGKTERRHFHAAYRKAFIDNLHVMVRDGRLDKKILEFDLERIAAAVKPERDNLFEYLGFQTLYDRYLLREEGGERKLETIQAFWMRVAMGLAIDEKKREDRAIEFYEVMSTLHYVPSTPTLFHSGTTRAQMSSCYLNTVDDDLSHIFKVYGDNAQLSKYSGGIGTDWTNVRATGSLIKATNVNSQGVIPFLRIANDVTVAINRSGKRRGATASYLETWHMDIEDFLDLRRNTGDERRRTHDMNTVNWIPDLFMKRINDSGQWTLFSPSDVPELHNIYGSEFEKKYIEYEQKADQGELTHFKRLPAKELWRKMITMLFETGHPWVTFKDPSNVRSPQDHVGVIHNSNLCTEITLNTSDEETAVCNLGSVNLGRHMTDGKLDEEKIAKTVKVAIRMLDNVIDLNYYPTKEAKTSNLRHRPIGLGIMGFQDALYLADMDFDSDETVRFADYSMELISYHAILSSARLAEERGAYETFEGSKWDRGIFPVDTLNLLEQERGMPIGVMRTSRLDWTPVREAVKQHGMRNSNTMAIAPTATISNISGCYPCIEPIYKNLYVKANMSGDFTVVNKYLVEDLKKLGLWNQTVLEEIKQHDGSIGEVSVIPPRLRAKYKEVFDIDTEWLIKAAAYRGKWIDQSQSLNIFYKGTSGKRLAELYVLAWHMGLKTTYYLRTQAASSVEKSSVGLQGSTAPLAAFVATAPPVAPVAVAPATPVAAELALPRSDSSRTEVAGSTVVSAPVSIPAPVAKETPAAVSSEAPVTAAPSPTVLAAAPIVANAVVSLEPEAPKPNIETATTTATMVRSATELATVSEGDGPKLCLIDDPDCEACQ
jgi:ribonucleoside-diphosphate reductase alpha chain